MNNPCATIRKSQESLALFLQYQRKPDAAWDGPAWETSGGVRTFSAVKDELRSALIKEQHGLCAYCMQRLSLDVVIEHVQPRSRFPEKQLDYYNLVACCSGSLASKEVEAELCCDKCKSDRDLSFHPADSSFDVASRVSYGRDGRIKADSAVLQEDFDTRLNLNAKLLKENRRQAYEGMLASVKRKFGKKKPTYTALSRLIRDHDERQFWPAFWGCTRWFLGKMRDKA